MKWCCKRGLNSRPLPYQEAGRQFRPVSGGLRAYPKPHYFQALGRYARLRWYRPAKPNSPPFRYPDVTPEPAIKKKLTEIAVQKLAPEAGKRIEVFDTLTPGLALRITEGGKKSWSVMYRVAGRAGAGNRGALRRMTLGAYPLIDLKAARGKARSATDLADRGDDPADQRKDELRQSRIVSISLKVSIYQKDGRSGRVRTCNPALMRGWRYQLRYRAMIGRLFRLPAKKPGHRGRGLPAQQL